MDLLGMYLTNFPFHSTSHVCTHAELEDLGDADITLGQHFHEKTETGHAFLPGFRHPQDLLVLQGTTSTKSTRKKSQENMHNIQNGTSKSVRYLPTYYAYLRTYLGTY